MHVSANLLGCWSMAAILHDPVAAVTVVVHTLTSNTSSHDNRTP